MKTTSGVSVPNPSTVPNLLSVIGGGPAPSLKASLLASQGGGEKVSFTFSSFWGVIGILAVLGNAVKRLLPIALEPFKQGDFTPLLWAQYGLFALFMAYAEGYKVSSPIPFKGLLLDTHYLSPFTLEKEYVNHGYVTSRIFCSKFCCLPGFPEEVFAPRGPPRLYPRLLLQHLPQDLRRPVQHGSVPRNKETEVRELGAFSGDFRTY